MRVECWGGESGMFLSIKEKVLLYLGQDIRVVSFTYQKSVKTWVLVTRSELIWNMVSTEAMKAYSMKVQDSVGYFSSK